MNPDDAVFVSQGPFARQKELRALLASAGIRAELVLPPGARPDA